MVDKMTETPYPGIVPWLAIRKKVNEIIDNAGSGTPEFPIYDATDTTLQSISGEYGEIAWIKTSSDNWELMIMGWTYESSGSTHYVWENLKVTTTLQKFEGHVTQVGNMLSFINQLYNGLLVHAWDFSITTASDTYVFDSLDIRRYKEESSTGTLHIVFHAEDDNGNDHEFDYNWSTDAWTIDGETPTAVTGTYMYTNAIGTTIAVTTEPYTSAE